MKKNFKALLGICLILSLQLANLALPRPLNSANLTNLKDTLDYARITFSGRLGATYSAGTTTIALQTSSAAGYMSVSTRGLKVGETLHIGSNNYTIVDIIDDTTLTITPGLLAGDLTLNTWIYNVVQPIHTITFNPATAQPNAYFRVLLPAAASNGNNGSPDASAFDFNTLTTANISATDTTGYTFISAVHAATPSGSTGCTSPANYHCFEFHYNGSGNTASTVTLTVGNSSKSLLAPSPADTTQGTSENFTYIVQQYNASHVLVDQTQGKIALIEPVRITATVDPSISFTIAGVASGTRCGQTLDVDTTGGTGTPMAVPFGTMALNTFKEAAHLLTVSTNADYGYVVTAIENDQMGKDGGTAPYIPDTACGGTACTHTTARDWTSTSYPGLGYSIENVSATTPAFQYNAGGSFMAKQFAALIETEPAQTLFSSSTIANNEQAYVCYRLSVGATQEAGDYENQVVYTATASF